MSFYDRWLSGIRGSEMFAAVAATTGAAWTAMASIDPVWPVHIRLVFAGSICLVSIVLYVRNPKDRQWMPATGSLEETLRGLAGPLIEEYLGRLLTGNAGKVVAAILPAGASVPATRAAPATSAPPAQSVSRAAPPPATKSSIPPVPPPMPPPAPEPAKTETTLDVGDALEQILVGQQQTAVAMQAIVKHLKGVG